MTPHLSRWLDRLTRLSAVALVAALPLTASAGSGTADDPLKVGFVYIGPVGDFGWTYQHEQGRLALEKEFSDRIETHEVENVPEGADAERVIRNMARSGDDLIYTTSFGYMNPTARVAKDFPDTVFMHATGYKRGDNLGTYIGSTYEGRYVSGTAAGLMTKSNEIGYIASYPIPEVIRDINAVQLSMQKVNPDAHLNVVWVNTWYDPAKEADAANALIDKGVDVLIQHTDSPAAMQVAERRGVRAVGQASDMSRFGPDAQLFSVVDNWAPFYIANTQKVIDGTWKSEDHWGGMAEGTIEIASINDNIPADVRSQIDDVISGIKSGKLKPFTGPIRDQSGELRVPEGESLTHEQLAGMDYFVQGVDAQLPD